MAEQPKDPFEAELARRTPQDPFEAELRKRNQTLGGTAVDVGTQFAANIPKGVAELGMLIPRGLTWATGLGKEQIQEADKQIASVMPEPQTTAGRYAGAAGEAVGSAVVPGALMLRAARALPAVAPAGEGFLTRHLLRPMSTMSTRGVAASEAAMASGAGLAQEGAKDAGYGPVGQIAAGLVGGALPALGAAPLRAIGQRVEQTRVGWNPHAKVAGGLGEEGLDELARATAVGATGMRPAESDRVINILGQEMVRTGGDRQAAYNATVQRLMQEHGLSQAGAVDNIQRVMRAQLDNELMLGEYPTVAGTDLRLRPQGGRTATTVMEDLDAANAMRNPAQAQAARIAADPGHRVDAPTHWMLDTTANAGTPGASQTIRDAINNRLGNLTAQTERTITSWMPPGMRTPEAVEAALERIRAAGRAAYRNVYNNPDTTNYGLMTPLLQRTVERHLNRLAGMGAERREAMRRALDELYIERPTGFNERAALPGTQDELASLRMAIREARRQIAESPARRAELTQLINQWSREADRLGEQARILKRDASPATQTYLMPTLEQLQNARTAIRGMIRRGTEAEQQALGPLYRDLTRIMERASPGRPRDPNLPVSATNPMEGGWRQANRQWADLAIDEVAQELGQNLATRASPNFREQMRQFRGLAPEAQDFVRVELAQQFQDMLVNGKTAEQIFKTDHVKQLVRTVFGDEAAVAMRRMVRDQQVAGRSRDMMHGSPTQPRQARQAAMNADIDLLANAEVPTSVGGFLAALKRHTIDRMKHNRNEGIADILTTPVRDTPAMAQQIEQLRQAAARAAAAARERPSMFDSPGNAGRFAPVVGPLGEDAYYDENGLPNINIRRPSRP